MPVGLAETLHLDEVRTRIAGTFQASLRWDRDDFYRPATADEPVPSGYSQLSSIQGTVSLADPIYFQGVTVPGQPDTGNCPSWVGFPAGLKLSSADGAFAIETGFTLQLRQEKLVWDLFGDVDLSQVRGSLDMKIDETRPHIGGLQMVLFAFPSGLRGRIRPYLYYFKDAAAAARFDPRSDVIEGVEYAPVFTRFPADECDFDRIPVDPEAPQAWLDGKSFAQTFAAARDGTQPTTPTPARWREGVSTDVSIDIGEPQPGPVCMGVVQSMVDFKFATAGRVVSTDGRVAVSLGSGELAVETGTQRPVTFGLRSELRDIPADQFSSIAGIHGVDPGGRTTLTATSEADFFQEGVGLPTGLVEVWGPEQIDCLIWPLNGPYDALCRLPPP
jgi:hypothetical protein